MNDELSTASSFWSKADQWSLWLSKLGTTFATLQGSTLLSGRLSQFWSAHWWAFNQTLLLCRTIRNKWSLQIVCLGTERKKYKIHLLTQTALAKYYCSLVCKRTSSPVLPKTSWRWQDAVTVLGIYNKNFFFGNGNLANMCVQLRIILFRSVYFLFADKLDS